MFQDFKKYFAFILIIAICIPFRSQGAEKTSAAKVLTLEEAIKEALENNYQLKIQSKVQAKSKINRSLDYASLLPTLQAKVGAHHLSKKSSEVLSGLAYRTQLKTHLNLEYNLLNILNSVYLYQKSWQEHGKISLETEKMMQETVQDVIIAYYGLVVKQQEEKVLEEVLKLSTSQCAYVKQQYKLGKASKGAYLTSKVSCNNDKANLLRYKNAVIEASARLYLLLGRKAPLTAQVASTIPLDQHLSWVEISEAVRTSNIDMKIAEKNCSITSMGYRFTKFDLLPKLSLDINYSPLLYEYAKHDKKKYSGKKRKNHFTYGFSVGVDLFKILSSHKTIRTAKLNKVIAELARADARETLEASLKNQFAHYTNQWKFQEWAKEALELSQENARIALEEYKLGKRSALSLQEARKDVKRAHFNLLESAYKMKKAEISLQRMAGKILELKN